MRSLFMPVLSMLVLSCFTYSSSSQNLIPNTRLSETKLVSANLSKSNISIENINVNDELNNWTNASLFARDSSSQVAEFLTLLDQDSVAFINRFATLTSPNEFLKNNAYILLALENPDKLNTYFNTLKSHNLSTADSNQIRIKIEYIRGLLDTLSTNPEKTHFSLFASGDFLSTIQSSSPNNSNVVSGNIGVKYSYRRISLGLKFLLVSNQDTITNDYGSQILAPAKGKGFGTGVAGISWHFAATKDNLRTYEVNLVGSLSKQRWRLDSSNLRNIDSINTHKDNIFTKSASIAGVDLTLSNTINLKDSVPVGNNKYAVSFGYNLGLAGRFLGGDILKPLQDSSNVLSKTGYYINRFPTKRTSFFGFEAGGNINIGPILAEFEAYYFPASSKDIRPLEGLSGLQISFGASINLSLFSF